MRDIHNSATENTITIILGAYQDKSYAEEHALHHPAKIECEEQEGPEGPELISIDHYGAAYIQETEIFGQMVYDYERSIALPKEA